MTFVFILVLKMIEGATPEEALFIGKVFMAGGGGENCDSYVLKIGSKRFW